jgi:carboxyl-terminal processing protease
MLDFRVVRRPWRFASYLLFLAILLGGGFAGGRLFALGGNTDQDLKLFTELLRTAQQNYGHDVTYEDLVFAGINGMVRTLDPHTTFLSPDAYAQMRSKHSASFYGLGILVGIRNGRLTVITPIDGTPAARLGIRAGDIISAIEGEPTLKMSADDAVSKLKGPKGTEVHITILRAGLPEPLQLTVVRAEIPQSTVRYAYMIEPGTGYIAITDFSRSTGSEVAQALEKLRGEGMQRLILDLRNNGGGLLDQAIEVCDQFLAPGSSIVQTRGRTHESLQSFAADGHHPRFDLPLVVLVNSGTASAAEIVSGAIQDHDAGLVVGTPTWGKGLVQTVYNLSYGAGLALTTAKYYTPSGRLIQRDYHSFFDYYTRSDVPDDSSDTKASPPKTAKDHPAFATDLGRKVYGGGGITPDVHVEAREVPAPLQFLLAHAAFFRFAVDWANRHPEFDRQWTPDDATIAEFEQWLASEKLQTVDQAAKLLAVPADRAYVERQIRADVLGSRYGIEASHQVLAGGDNQIQGALGLFPKAASLLAQRRALGEPGDLHASAAATGLN